MSEGPESVSDHPGVAASRTHRARNCRNARGLIGVPRSQNGGWRCVTNATYNVMETAAVLSKGLYRIWDEMRKADDEQLARLVSHMREHLDHEQIVRRTAT